MRDVMRERLNELWLDYGARKNESKHVGEVEMN